MYIVFVKKTKQDLQSQLGQGGADVALVKCHIQLIRSMCLKPETPTESARRNRTDRLVCDGGLPGDPSIESRTAWWTFSSSSPPWPASWSPPACRLQAGAREARLHRGHNPGSVHCMNRRGECVWVNFSVPLLTNLDRHRPWAMDSHEIARLQIQGSSGLWGIKENTPPLPSNRSYQPIPLCSHWCLPFPTHVITQLCLASIIFIQRRKLAIITTVSVTEKFQLTNQDNSSRSRRPRDPSIRSHVAGS